MLPAELKLYINSYLTPQDIKPSISEVKTPSLPLPPLSIPATPWYHNPLYTEGIALGVLIVSGVIIMLWQYGVFSAMHSIAPVVAAEAPSSELWSYILSRNASS
jgi:hypothetical protein